jgi:hypothetical protein
MLAEFERVIVVDWSCPQDSGKWAAKEGAEVVYRTGEKYFNVSKARNFGAQFCVTKDICFVDADTLCMPGLRPNLESLLDTASMVIAPRTIADKDFPSLYGFLAASFTHIVELGGYPEHFEGYGIEDQYMRAQLKLELCLTVRCCAPQFLASIRHTNELRGRYYRESIGDSNTQNYSQFLHYLESKGVSDWTLDPRTVDIAPNWGTRDGNVVALGQEWV